ncbi:hypothetical protein JDS71_29590, partial [Bacillus cereus]|nr:hypothetical protein [Bacillus cereus]
LFFGFFGVGVISCSSLSGLISIIGVLLALGCAIGWALGTVFIKITGHRVNAIWMVTLQPVSYTHLRAHETGLALVCRL